MLLFAKKKSFFYFFFYFLINISFADSYKVLLLSDTHYDCFDVRHPKQELDFKEQQKFYRNISSWNTVMPSFLQSAGQHCAEDLPFALHLGDFIHGDCGSALLHKKALQEALFQFEKYIPCPVYIVKGNHDVLGEGGEKAFKNVMYPYLKKLGKNRKLRTKGANFYFKQDNDLYIGLDCMKINFSFFCKSFKKKS